MTRRRRLAVVAIAAAAAASGFYFYSRAAGPRFDSDGKTSGAQDSTPGSLAPLLLDGLA